MDADSFSPIDWSPRNEWWVLNATLCSCISRGSDTGLVCRCCVPAASLLCSVMCILCNCCAMLCWCTWGCMGWGVLKVCMGVVYVKTRLVVRWKNHQSGTNNVHKPYMILKWYSMYYTLIIWYTQYVRVNVGLLCWSNEMIWVCYVS